MFSTEANLLSFEDYLAYDDGTDNYYELVAGKLQLMNSPTVLHLLISKFLEQVFEDYFNEHDLPFIFLQGIGIRTGWKTSRIPDLLILEKSLLTPFVNQSAVLTVPPTLVVEIVSPESIKRDYRYQRSEYAALGIPEYWIIDPIQQQVTVLSWQEGLYEETILSGQDRIESQQFPQLRLTPEEILNQKL
jgi:Uma2 family endonuclease